MGKTWFSRFQRGRRKVQIWNFWLLDWKRKVQILNVVKHTVRTAAAAAAAATLQRKGTGWGQRLRPHRKNRKLWRHSNWWNVITLKVVTSSGPTSGSVSKEGGACANSKNNKSRPATWYHRHREETRVSDHWMLCSEGGMSSGSSGCETGGMEWIQCLEGNDTELKGGRETQKTDRDQDLIQSFNSVAFTNQ